jgi:hypothetical protein
LLRNLLANPAIRYLVVCGSDLTGTASDVRAFFDPAGDPADLPGDAAVALRSRVSLVDLVGQTDANRVAQAVLALPVLPPSGEALLLDMPALEAATFTAEASGFVVRNGSAARAWVQALSLLRRFGAPCGDAPDSQALEGVSVIVGAEPTPEDGSRWYAQADTPPERPNDEKELLSWHQRRDGVALTVALPRLEAFRAFRGQVERLRGRLRAEARSRETRATELTLFTGVLLLEHADAPAVDELLRRRYPRSLPWNVDQRGLFWIHVRAGTILLEHGTAAGPTGLRWESDSAERLCRQVLNDQMVSLPEHAAYLGRELQRAETALRLGLEYRQDADLDFGSPRTGA